MDRENFRIIRINNKTYHLLGMYWGRAHCGELLDVNNEEVWSGIIWHHQPFWIDDEVPFAFIIKTYCYVIRYFKKDVWGRSEFLKQIS